MKLLSAIIAAASIAATPAFAAESDTITIGFTASRTGPLNVDSTGQERGYDFWRDEVNAAEGRVFTEGLPAALAAMPEIRRAYLGM